MNPLGSVRSVEAISSLNLETRQVVVSEGDQQPQMSFQDIYSAFENLKSEKKITLASVSKLLHEGKNNIGQLIRQNDPEDLGQKCLLCSVCACAFETLSQEETCHFFTDWLSKPSLGGNHRFILGIAPFLDEEKQEAVVRVVVQMFKKGTINLGTVLEGVTFNADETSPFFEKVFQALKDEPNHLGESSCVSALSTVDLDPLNLTLWDTILSPDHDPNDQIKYMLACVKNEKFTKKLCQYDTLHKFHDMSERIANFLQGLEAQLDFPHLVKELGIFSLPCIFSVVANLPNYRNDEGFRKAFMAAVNARMCRALQSWQGLPSEVFSAVVNTMCLAVESENLPQIQALLADMFTALADKGKEEYVALFGDFKPSLNSATMILRILTISDALERAMYAREYMAKCVINETFVEAISSSLNFSLGGLFPSLVPSLAYLEQDKDQILALSFILSLNEQNLKEASEICYQKEVSGWSKSCAALILSNALIYKSFLDTRVSFPDFWKKSFFNLIIQKLKYEQGEDWCLDLIPLVLGNLKQVQNTDLYGSKLRTFVLSEFLKAFLPKNSNEEDLNTLRALERCLSCGESFDFSSFALQDATAIIYLKEILSEQMNKDPGCHVTLENVKKLFGI